MPCAHERVKVPSARYAAAKPTLTYPLSAAAMGLTCGLLSKHRGQREGPVSQPFTWWRGGCYPMDGFGITVAL